MISRPIPIYTTETFKKKFFSPENEANKMFVNDYERFLIAKFRDIRKIMKLPITHYRRPITEIVFITRGSITKGCNLSKVTVKSGEIHLWSANQIATVDNFSDDIEGFYCHFDLNYMFQYHPKYKVLEDLDEINKRTFYEGVNLSRSSFKIIYETFKRMNYLFKNELNHALISSYLISILLETKANFNETIIEKKTSRPTYITQRFKDLLFERIISHQSPSYYASLLHISENHLNKTLKVVTGKTTSTWIAEALILEAKVLLSNPENTVGMVAYYLNFQDQSYFTKYFKKHTQFTPSEYQNRLNNTK